MHSIELIELSILIYEINKLAFYISLYLITNPIKILQFN